MRCSITLLAVFTGTLVLCRAADAEKPVSMVLADADSGTTSPQGQYRWMDVADQLYDVDVGLDGYSYQDSYDYTQASVLVDFFTDAQTLHGTLTASNLKPNFAYQFKLVGDAGTEANERFCVGQWMEPEQQG